MYELILKLIRR